MAYYFYVKEYKEHFEYDKHCISKYLELFNDNVMIIRNQLTLFVKEDLKNHKAPKLSQTMIVRFLLNQF
jgi:hypothetical protein